MPLIVAGTGLSFFGLITANAYGQQPSGAEESSVNYTIPDKFRAGQVAMNAESLVLTKNGGAFEFSMPDGKPLTHDYGLEGMPNTTEDETVYPVVVNSISYDPPDRTRIPERGMANLLNASAANGVIITKQYGMTTIDFTPHVREGFIQYYTIMPHVGDSGRLSAFIRCPYTRGGSPTSSSCDGWEYAEDLKLVLRVRFPRLKIGDFPAIGREVLTLLESWKTR